MNLGQNINGKGKVLVVDDEELIVQLIERVLRREGYRVATASTGSEGVLAAIELDPDLILMDISMPELDGYEATQLIKRIQSSREIPIIMVTGRDIEEDGGRAFEYGAISYLRKPFNNSNLVDVVALALLSSADNKLSVKAGSQITDR